MIALVALVACVPADLEEIRVPSVVQRDTAIVVAPAPVMVASIAPVEPPPSLQTEELPRPRVVLGGNVVMNNVTINGDVYIGSPYAAPPPPDADAAPALDAGACDRYVDRVEACTVHMLGSRARAAETIDGLENARRTWARFADDPRMRDTLARSCTTAHRRYDASVGALCPRT